MKLPAKNISRLTLWSLVLLWLAACKTPQGIGYFQDMEDGQKVLIAHADGVKLKPGDQLSIIVTTPSVEITNTLNLPAKSQVIGTTEEVALGRARARWAMPSTWPETLTSPCWARSMWQG